MKDYNVLNTLFVDIDVSSKSNMCIAINFDLNELLRLKTDNNNTGAFSFNYVCERIIFHLFKAT